MSRPRRLLKRLSLLLGSAAASVFAFSLVLALPQASGAQEFNLASLFEPGHLLGDENGDGVPDRSRASLILPPTPTATELAAAAEVSARLGFETMALDLPISRGVRPGLVGILVGNRAVAAAGLTLAAFTDGTSGGNGRVATLQEGTGALWVALLADDDDGLLEAAHLFAGALPHTRTLSSPSLADVSTAIVDWLVADTTRTDSGFELAVHAAAVAGEAGDILVAARLGHPDAAVLSAAILRLDSLAQARATGSPITDSTTLRFEGLASISISPATGSAPVVTLSTATPPPQPGPVPARPGSGGKDALDLSNLYTKDGALGDSDSNEIPDRVDVVLVPGESGASALPDFAGRLGLESTGLTLPLVKLPERMGEPSKSATMVLVGTDHPLVDELADSGRIDLSQMTPGTGLIELVPKAFGTKPALVVTGADPVGAEIATRHVAEVLPLIAGAGDGAPTRDGLPTLDDLEYELWGLLSGHTPAGQAATGLYKLDRILAELSADGTLAADGTSSAEVLMSVEKPEPGLEALIRSRASAAGIGELTVAVDDRNVQAASEIFEENVPVPSEVDRFWEALDSRVIPGVGPGTPVRVEARLSEPPAVRAQLAEEARERLIAAGAAQETTVRILSAFKQGFSWLDEVVKPRLKDQQIEEIVIEFRRNEAPDEWPQQAIQTPVRWLHEIFPIDEVLARDLGVELDKIRFQMVEEGPTYAVRAMGPGDTTLYTGTFEPKWVLRPYFDRFVDYEMVRVTTGWIRAWVESAPLVDERIVTDPEWVWDHFQESTLPRVYDYVMDRHDGNPRGGGQDAPYFGEFTVEVELSEPDYRLGIDNEIVAPMDALHEEVYFGTLEFFHLIGRNARGQDLTYPGRVLPLMRPKSDGKPGVLRTRLTGFVTNRPAVVVRVQTEGGMAREIRLDIAKVELGRPSVRRMEIAGASPTVRSLDLRVRVDTEADDRTRLLNYARPEQVDETMISAEQVTATLSNLEALRAAGSYTSALAYDNLGEIRVWSEWTHDQDPESRETARLAANGTPTPPPAWSDLVPADWTYEGDRIVQWDSPIPPPEGHEMLAKMARTFDHATMYRAGQSYLGKTTWAMDLTPPIQATHRSRTKASTFKPTVIYSARQHANEVSSTSHVLRHAELLLTDPAQQMKLDKVNVVIHPFTNPDGAQLAYDLYRSTPDYILHAGYLGSLGMDATSGSDEDFPIYPESKIRTQLWERWLPDIFLNPHGYPSHQVVQLFSEYTGLVRRGRVTERNWGFNKGWFMPGFGYVDDPKFPRHRDAAFEIRDYITAGINSNPDVFDLNQRSYARYRRYGADYDPEVFRLPMVDSVLIEMPLKGSRGQPGGRGFNPNVTIWSGTTEAPDETAYGDYMKLVAKAGLSWDQAILDYLYDGDHDVERSGSTFFGGVTLKMFRPRPPKEKDTEPS